MANKSNQPRQSLVPGDVSHKSRKPKKTRASRVPESNYPSKKTKKHSAEIQILNLLAVMATLCFLLPIMSKMWQVQIEGDIPVRHVDDWARDKVKLLLNSGCLYVETDEKAKSPLRLDGLDKDPISLCSVLSFAKASTDKEKKPIDYCVKGKYKEYATNDLEKEIAYLYCEEERFLRGLNTNIQKGYQNHVLSGEPLIPFYFHKGLLNIDVSSRKSAMSADGRWHWRGEQNTEFENFKKLLPQIEQFTLDHSLHLQGSKKAKETKQQLATWLRERKVVPPLVFVNPFFVTDPAEAERRMATPRGSILTSDLSELAVSTQNNDGKFDRIYANDPAFESLINRDAGLESVLGAWIMADTDVGKECAELDHSDRGCDIMLSLDKILTDTVYGSLQKSVVSTDSDPTLAEFRKAWAASDADYAQQLLAVMLDVKTGEVLVSTQYPALPEMKKHTPIQQHIFPGSTFKPITAIAAMQTGVLQPGSANLEDNTQSWSGADCMKNAPIAIGHIKDKSLPLEIALVQSQNQYFARVANKIEALGEGVFANTLDEILKFGEFNWVMPSGKNLDNLADYLADNSLENDNDCPERAIARAGFGQGVVRVTPLFMAYSALAIANGGEAPAPILVKSLGRLQTENNLHELSNEPQKQWLGLSNAQPSKISHFSPLAAQDIGALMCQVAEKGTAKKYFSQHTGHFPIRVAIKTGTATYSAKDKRGLHDLSVVGYYPAEQPKVAFYIGIRRIRPTTSQEDGFLSSEILVPVAAKVIRDSLAPLHIVANPSAACPSRPLVQ